MIRYFAGHRLGHYTDRTGTVRYKLAGTINSHYYPFGEEITSTAGDTYKFAQLYRDADTGLDYAMARYHSSTIGRFLSVDRGGIDPANPQLWNRYAYSFNDPINYGDPSGLDPCSFGGDFCITVTGRAGRAFEPIIPLYRGGDPFFSFFEDFLEGLAQISPPQQSVSRQFGRGTLFNNANNLALELLSNTKCSNFIDVASQTAAIRAGRAMNPEDLANFTSARIADSLRSRTDIFDLYGTASTDPFPRGGTVGNFLTYYPDVAALTLGSEVYLNRNFLFGLPAIENIHASASQRVQCFLREDHQLRASLSGSPKTVQSASKPSFFRQLSIPGG